MTFASAITGRDSTDSQMVRYGTYTSSASGTGGDINTGLTMCNHIQLAPTGSAVVTDAPVVNETLPIAGSAVTIVTTQDEEGYWRAWGY